MLNESTYQGRQSRRSDGKEKRLKLLNATLKIIIKDGVRGVRHRAVAAEAGVSLSSTTYYFKDIHDLITDAFTYFAHQELEQSKQLEALSLGALQQLQQSEKTLDKAELSSLISVFIQQHISQQVKDIDRRRLEYAFQNVALHNNKLAELMITTQSSMLQMIEQFFTYIGSNKPMADAHLTLASIRHIEYQLVVDKKLSIDDPLVNDMIRQLIDGLFTVID